MKTQVVTVDEAGRQLASYVNGVHRETVGFISGKEAAAWHRDLEVARLSAIPFPHE